LQYKPINAGSACDAVREEALFKHPEIISMTADQAVAYGLKFTFVNLAFVFRNVRLVTAIYPPLHQRVDALGDHSAVAYTLKS